MSRSTSAPVAATFADKAAAAACRSELHKSGFSSWMAVLAPAPAAADAAATSGGSGPAPEPHAVGESSDGVVGALGRYFSGERSLQHALVEHGLSSVQAAELDESAGGQGAVIVVAAGERADEAASLLGRSATHVIGPDGETFEPYSSTTNTVPGQGDELDRGTNIGRAGGGLGATTGFWDDGGARKDLDPEEFYDARSSGGAPSDAAARTGGSGDPPRRS